MIEPTDNVERWRHIIDTAPNPVTRQFAAGFLAMVLLRHEMTASRVDTNERETINMAIAVYEDRIARATHALQAIPDDEWSKWCELPKNQLIREIAAA